jgi:hypothetical protein
VAPISTRFPATAEAGTRPFMTSTKDKRGIAPASIAQSGWKLRSPSPFFSASKVAIDG